MTNSLCRYIGSYGRLPIKGMMLIFLFALLTGCDGGIFGTGDGEIIETDSPVATPPEGTPGVDSSPDPSPDNSISDSALIEFENSSPVTSRTDALIRLVHAVSIQQDSIVVTVNGDNDQPLLPLPGLAFLGGANQYLSVPAASGHHIRVFLSEDFRSGNYNEIAAVNPLNVARGTISTLIIRGNSSDSATPVSILPATTNATSTGAGGELRATHSASLFSVNGPIDVYLVESGTDITDVAPTIAALSYNSNPVSNYAAMAAGQYEIVVTSENSKTTLFSGSDPVVLGDGAVITLVVRDDPTGIAGQDIGVLVVQDSNLPSN